MLVLWARGGVSLTIDNNSHACCSLMSCSSFERTKESLSRDQDSNKAR